MNFKLILLTIFSLTLLAPQAVSAYAPLEIDENGFTIYTDAATSRMRIYSSTDDFVTFLTFESCNYTGCPTGAVTPAQNGYIFTANLFAPSTQYLMGINSSNYPTVAEIQERVTTSGFPDVEAEQYLYIRTNPDNLIECWSQAVGASEAYLACENVLITSPAEPEPTPLPVFLTYTPATTTCNSPTSTSTICTHEYTVSTSTAPTDYTPYFNFFIVFLSLTGFLGLIIYVRNLILKFL